MVTPRNSKMQQVPVHRLVYFHFPFFFVVSFLFVCFYVLFSILSLSLSGLQVLYHDANHLPEGPDLLTLK